MDKDKKIDKRLFLTIVGIVILLFAFLILNKKEQEDIYMTRELLLSSGHRFTLEVADNEYLRSRGLMFREAMDRNKGMLFVFEDESSHGFWMKNTLIPLDMIFISDSGLVVDIIHDVPPCKKKECDVYTPSKSYLYVIELNSGISNEIGLSIGDTITLPQ